MATANVNQSQCAEYLRAHEPSNPKTLSAVSLIMLMFEQTYKYQWINKKNTSSTLVLEVVLEKGNT